MRLIDVLVEECYEALLRGCPVAEKKCTSCQIALPYEGNPHPGRYREVTKTKCVNCGAADSLTRASIVHWVGMTPSCDNWRGPGESSCPSKGRGC